MGKNNVDIEIKGKKMVITIDTSKEFGLSKSQKTKIVASTGGNIEVEDGLFLGLNAYRYAGDK